MAELECCKTMKQQLTDRCEQHGQECPDNVIHIGVGTLIPEQRGKLFLEAKNATYSFQYCPWCGKELPKECQA